MQSKVARIYMRVSSNDQDLSRQDALIESAKKAGYYVGGVYREKASGARADRPELLRMIDDLQTDDVVIAEKMDRLSRLPLPEAEALIDRIRGKGAKLAIPNVIDLSELEKTANGTAKIVIDAVQNLLLKLALQMAREDYEDRRKRQNEGILRAKRAGRYRGRVANKSQHELIVRLRTDGHTIDETARLARCSVSQVKRIWKDRRSTE